MERECFIILVDQHHLTGRGFPLLAMTVLNDQEGSLRVPPAHGNSYSPFAMTSGLLTLLT